MTSPSHQPQSILVQDGVPHSIKTKKPGTLKADGSTSTPKKTPGDRAKSTSATKQRSSIEGKYECSRCQRTDFMSLEHFQDHCSKCVQ